VTSELKIICFKRNNTHRPSYLAASDTTSSIWCQRTWIRAAHSSRYVQC